MFRSVSVAKESTTQSDRKLRVVRGVRVVCLLQDFKEKDTSKDSSASHWDTSLASDPIVFSAFNAIAAQN
jgi:hypothetical protein